MNPSQTDAHLGLSEAAIKLRLLLPGFLISRSLQVAAELDLASHLRDGDKDGAELAALCGTRSDSLTARSYSSIASGIFPFCSIDFA